MKTIRVTRLLAVGLSAAFLVLLIGLALPGFAAPIHSAAAGSGDFSIVVLPDSQWYTAHPAYAYCVNSLGKHYMSNDGPATFDAQMQWIVDNRAAWNIAYVAHVGDVVNDGDYPATITNTFPGCDYVCNDTSGMCDWNGVEWANAANSMSIIEQAIAPARPYGIPFGLVVGNHDKYPKNSLAFTTTDEGYNAFFGTSRFASRIYNPITNSKGYYGGYYADLPYGGNNDNHYDLFEANGVKFVVVYIEYYPNYGSEGGEILQWARDVLNQYSNRRGIVVLHDLLKLDGTLSPQGSTVWNRLTNSVYGRVPTNLFLMLGGHIEGVARTTKNLPNGKAVHLVAADYSAETHDNAQHGGNGWLRILKFSLSSNEIQVYTYSPTMEGGQFVIDSETGEYKTDAANQFTLLW